MTRAPTRSPPSAVASIAVSPGMRVSARNAGGYLARSPLLRYLQARSEPDASHARTLSRHLERCAEIEHFEHGHVRRVADDRVRRCHRDPIEHTGRWHAEALVTETARILDGRGEAGSNDAQMGTHSSALSVSMSNAPSALAACMSS